MPAELVGDLEGHGGIVSVGSAVLVGLSAGQVRRGSVATAEVLAALAFLIVGVVLLGLGPPRRGALARPLRANADPLGHTRSIPLGGDVDLDALASSTAGMVGSDLANLCNEAALLATRRNLERVEMRDFTDSLEKILLAPDAASSSLPWIESAPPSTRPGTPTSGCSPRGRILSAKSRSSPAPWPSA
jgi:hypothetical protein